MKKDILTIVGAVGGALGVGFGAYNLYQNKKLQKERDDLLKTLSDKIDISVSEIRDIGNIDISEKLVKAAIAQASTDAVAHYAEQVRNDIISDMHSECWKAVQDLKDGVKDDVKKTLESKAKKVTIDDIKNEVVEKCTDESKRYIRTEMDEITSQYKKQIDNLTQVYNNISTAIGKEGK